MSDASVKLLRKVNIEQVVEDSGHVKEIIKILTIKQIQQIFSI